MEIREIKQTDYQETADLIIEAFSKSDHGYQDEAILVDKIRDESGYRSELELIALLDGKVVGHGLLSEACVLNEDNGMKVNGLVLAPLSISPNYQKQGIGGELMKALEKRVSSRDQFISILGDPKYYQRFDYMPASKFGVVPPFEVPDEYFMIKEMKKDSLLGSQGTLIYGKAFS